MPLHIEMLAERPERLADPYFAQPEPEELLYDQIEALWAPIAALLLGEQILPTTLAGLAACAGLGFVHFAGQGSIAWAMGRLPTSLASVVVLVQPVVATYAGFLLFGEALGPLQTLGAAVALSGVVLAQWASRPRPASAVSS